MRVPRIIILPPCNYVHSSEVGNSEYLLLEIEAESVQEKVIIISDCSVRVIMGRGGFCLIQYLCLCLASSESMVYWILGSN